jgi:hypothetical protein
MLDHRKRGSYSNVAKGADGLDVHDRVAYELLKLGETLCIVVSNELWMHVLVDIQCDKSISCMPC